VSEQLQRWSILAATGPLVLAQSDQEYAVYDQNKWFGQWPLTEQGYRFAVNTYEAHRQSLAHGVAYTASGYQDPARLGLPTDPVVKSQSYSAPLSFIGSTRRIVAWATKLAQRSPTWAILGWTLAIVGMLSAWAFILCWYVVIFGFFGILVIPYRLVRRSQRKNLHMQRTALATQQGLYQQLAAAQQQTARGQPAPPPPPAIGQPPPS
jgi:hypothetical protein